MDRHKIIIFSLIVFCIAGLGALIAEISMADDERGMQRHFEREDQHGSPFLESDNDGNETAGQMAAWFLLAANLPVALSLLVKGIDRFAPLRAEIKKTLTNLNRIQKKALMGLHYDLNPLILGIALWHWLSSRCKSSTLPELGLMVMMAVIILGVLIKFKWCPKAFRRHAYQIHTQPIIFVAMFTVLAIGHLIID